MKVAVLVVSRNRPDLVQQLAGWLARNTSFDHDLIVVEAGTEPSKLTPHTTIHYPDTDFRGKCLAHNMALEHARELGRMGRPYDYYWVLMNDVVFDEGVDAAKVLIDAMEQNPRLAILSPTCADGQYQGSKRRAGGGWRPVATCDYLGFMMRARAVEEVGFLNPEFRYCWGAIHELSYHLHHAGWLIGYSDDVTYEHLGGSTYGAKGTSTISREEYQRRAKRFAYAYFARMYGSGWPARFWAEVAPGGAEIDTFTQHNQLWASAFALDELAELAASKPIYVATEPRRRAPSEASNGARGASPTLATMTQSTPTGTRVGTQTTRATHLAPPTQELLRLHLGAGPDKRAGWVNVDVNPRFQPDIVAAAHSLPMLRDGSCSHIEACHLFEHLTLSEARQALREWKRLLSPGGELALELPNLERCVALIGTELEGYDLGLISLFGYPPEVDAQGAPQLHKWGWTPKTLALELAAAGFDAVRQVPITQTQRKAARFDRDMRLVASAQSTARAAATLAATPAPTASATDPLAVLDASRRNVLAWPRYDDAAELERFFHVFARVLSGREDCTLVLRVDPARDPSHDAVLAALAAMHARVLGESAPLDVMLLEGPLSHEDWRRLGALVTCRVRATSEAPPRDVLRQVATPVVGDAAALFGLVSGGSSCAPRRGNEAEQGPVAGLTPGLENGVIVPPGVTPDRELVHRINALHPWFYPVEIDGLTVVPGLGSVCSPEWLTNRASCRSTILVEEVLKRVDFRGKAVLDLACNCAFWSSFYAQAGAARVFGIEGRERHVEQARLYWEHGRFLAPGASEFQVGNISDATGWPLVRQRGPFDVTLCAGILYHVPNYAEILRWVAEVTREVMIVDTRVQDGEEVTIREPGDLTFNAIAETRDKIVPDRKRLLAAIRALGFEPEVLPVKFTRQLGVDDVDSYADGARITILARKVRAPASLHPDTVVLGGAR